MPIPVRAAHDGMTAAREPRARIRVLAFGTPAGLSDRSRGAGDGVFHGQGGLRLSGLALPQVGSPRES